MKRDQNRPFSKQQKSRLGNGDRSKQPVSKYKDERIIFGRNAVGEVLKHQPDKIISLITSNLESRDSRFGEIIKLAHENGIGVRQMQPHPFDALVGTSKHQGVAASVKPNKKLSVKELVEICEGGDQACILALDSVQDPHNFGAILRAAECFGVKGVIFSSNRGAGVTSVVTKTSSGASEFINLCEVANLRDGLSKLKQAGFWLVGADVSTKAENAFGFKFPAKCVIVMGSEGDGIQPLIKRELDYSVYIPMSGIIDSLNVSQATAVFLGLMTNCWRVVDSKSKLK